jgi:hypothetical protein
MIIDNRVLFLHIPRTGGRFLSYNFQKHYYCTSWNFKEKWFNKEVPHLNMIENNAYYVSTRMYDTFTIVRNPIDRFMSAICYTNRVNKKCLSYMFENETSFFKTVNDLRLNNSLSNWFEPQVNFIDYDTHIWKYENGFKTEFNQWLQSTVNLTLHPISEAEQQSLRSKTPSVLDLTDTQKQYIQNYYFLDFKTFDYSV